MKTTKLIGISLVLIGTLVVGGCGDNSHNSSTTEMKEPSMPTPTKLDRANWDGVD